MPVSYDAFRSSAAERIERETDPVQEFEPIQFDVDHTKENVAGRSNVILVRKDPVNGYDTVQLEDPITLQPIEWERMYVTSLGTCYDIASIRRWVRMGNRVDPIYRVEFADEDIFNLRFTDDHDVDTERIQYLEYYYRRLVQSNEEFVNVLHKEEERVLVQTEVFWTRKLLQLRKGYAASSSEGLRTTLELPEILLECVCMREMLIRDSYEFNDFEIREFYLKQLINALFPYSIEDAKDIVYVHAKHLDRLCHIPSTHHLYRQCNDMQAEIRMYYINRLNLFKDACLRFLEMLTSEDVPLIKKFTESLLTAIPKEKVLKRMTLKGTLEIFYVQFIKSLNRVSRGHIEELISINISGDEDVDTIVNIVKGAYLVRNAATNAANKLRDLNSLRDFITRKIEN